MQLTNDPAHLMIPHGQARALHGNDISEVLILYTSCLRKMLSELVEFSGFGPGRWKDESKDFGENGHLSVALSFVVERGSWRTCVISRTDEA